jgi:predicted DNA-binding WGR domain protein
MTAQPYHLYIERLDASRNMARYYVLQITMNLFGDICLTRSWGRIGKHGQTKEHVFEREADAIKLFLEILRRKQSKGYRPTISDGSNVAGRKTLN